MTAPRPQGRVVNKTNTCGTVSSYVHRGCRCEDCRAAMSAYKRAWRERGGPAVEHDRECSRRWKREHLGQPSGP